MTRFLTVHRDAAYRAALEQLGVAGYLDKRASGAALAAAVRAVAAGQRVRAGADDAAAEPVRLTAREAAVLRLLAAGLTNKAIAAALGRSAKTVEDHLAHLYAKLGVGSRAAALRAAQRRGLVLLDDGAAAEPPDG